MDYNAVVKWVLQTEAKELLDAKVLDTDWNEIVEFVVNIQGKVVVAGVGKSGLIGKKISATLSSTGTPSFFLHPTEAMHGDLGMIDKNDVILAISYSGESDELVAIMPHFKRLSGGIITMSRSAYSSVSKMGNFFIPIAVSKEVCPLNAAPTSSTTLTLALGDALAVCLMKKRNFSEKNFASFHPGGSLGKRLFVKVEDLMQTQNLPLIASDLSLKEAIIVMSEARLGSAIISENGKLVAVLSDGDLRRAIMKDSFDLNMPALSYASKNPIYCDNKELLAVEILRFIEEKKIQLLVITDRDKNILGAIHLHSLISAGIC